MSLYQCIFFFITSPKDTSNLFIFSPSPLPPSLSTLFLSLLGLLRQCLHWSPCSHSYTLIICFLPRIYKDQLNPQIRSCSFLDYYDCRLPASLRWKPELLIIPRRTPSFPFASSSHNTHSLFHHIPIVLLSFLCLKQSERAHWCIFVVVFAWNAHPSSHHIYLFLVCSWNFHSTVTITQKAFLYHAN